MRIPRARPPRATRDMRAIRVPSLSCGRSGQGSGGSHAQDSRVPLYGEPVGSENHLERVLPSDVREPDRDGASDFRVDGDVRARELSEAPEDVADVGVLHVERDTVPG